MKMSDLYKKFPSAIDSPAEHAFAVTPTNTTELNIATRSLYVGGSGNLNVILVGDTANTLFVGVGAGTILPIRVKVVHATNTTATNIVGLY
jgi:hypothetical protein